MILSICIPSHNRFDKLNLLIESILKAKSKKFEVVIVDNCSTQNIFSSIIFKDKRLRIIKRDMPVDGIKSGIDAMDYGIGRFVMLCLDKDYIDGTKLDHLIDILEHNSYIYGGRCVLNSVNKKYRIVGSKALIYYAYCGYHPTGMFFRKDIIEINKSKVSKENIYNPFYSDLLIATAASYGAILDYDFPLITIESAKDCANVKSHTYGKEKNDIYFFPEQRKKQMNIFVEHMSNLKVSKVEYYKLTKLLCIRTMYYCTLGFKDIMNNMEVCTHYGILKKNISFYDLYKEAIKFSNSFCSLKIDGISGWRKKSYVLCTWFHFPKWIASKIYHKWKYKKS